MLWSKLIGAVGVSSSAARGLFSGGISNATIDYIVIATGSNAVVFGNLPATLDSQAGCSDGSRGVFAGGTSTFTFGGGSIRSTYGAILYVTIATAGNATTLGNLSQARSAAGAVSDATRAVFGGGVTNVNDGSTYTTKLDYIAIATGGTATATASGLTVARNSLAGVSSATRGVFGGGFGSGGAKNTLDYLTISSFTGATTFGNLTIARYGVAGVSDLSRGVFCGGAAGSFPVTQYAAMDYITIATTGNATTFGNLTVARFGGAGVSNETRGAIGGGGNVIDYITIATTGNATDFGDLTTSRNNTAGASGQ